MRQVRDGVKAAIQKYGVKHEPADDHEARALEAAALSPPKRRASTIERALRPAVFLHLNLGGPMALSRVQFGRAVASAASLDADLVRGALRPAGTAPESGGVGLVELRGGAGRASGASWIWPCGRLFFVENLCADGVFADADLAANAGRRCGPRGAADARACRSVRQRDDRRPRGAARDFANKTLKLAFFAFQPKLGGEAPLRLAIQLAEGASVISFGPASG